MASRLIDNDETQDLSTRSAELCQACGLCCQGALHNHAALKSDEVTLATKLGIPLYEEKSTEAEPYSAFRLPCSFLEGTSCSVYIERPSPCRSYRCLLLQRFTQGTFTLKDSLDLVTIAQTLIKKITRQIGGVDPDQSIWDQIRVFYQGQDQSTNLTALQIDVKTLWNFCYYQFDPQVATHDYPEYKPR